MGVISSGSLLSVAPAGLESEWAMVVAAAVVVVGLERMGENCTERVRLMLACCCGGDLGGTGGGIVEVQGEREGEGEGGERVVILLGLLCYEVRWDGMV